jgi:tetratricopeptide (TPR) repeat protein
VTLTRDSGRRSELPPDVEDFTGRADLVSRLTGLFAPSRPEARTATPVVTVAGKGGVGKTALAVHVAHRIARHYPGGALYTDLRGVEDQVLHPGEVLAGFLRELGVAGDDIPATVEDRARMYRARLTGQRIFVLLDNAAEETQVRPLIPGAPECAVLITSRSRLSGLPGQTLSLDVMEEPQAVELLVKTLGTERVSAEEQAAKEIARLCGYLPLALRVVAARLESRPSWTLTWFAGRLGDERNRLNLLKVGDMEVRASLALSYDSRSDREKSAFRILGILTAANFPAWNLGVLADTDQATAEDTVEQLVDAELLEVSGVDAVGSIRYRFHDLLRDYARERLMTEESDDARRAALRRIVVAYIGLAREASAVLQPGAVQTTVGADAPSTLADDVRGDPRAWFASERAALVSLVEQSAEAGLWEETWQLAEPLVTMFNWRADWEDWETTQRIALDAANRANSALGRAVAQCHLGILYRELGRFDEAVALFTGSIAAFAEIGNEHREAIARRDLADTFRYNGRLPDAIAGFSAALEVFQRLSDSRSVAATLGGMADAYRGLSRWQESESRFEQSLALYHQLGDRAQENRHTVMLSIVYRDRFMNDRAETILRPAIAVFEELGDRRWEAQSKRLLATVVRNEGHSDEALRLLAECLPIYEDLLDRRFVAVCLRNRGDTYRLRNEYDHARADLAQARTIFTELGDRRWAARVRLSLADLHRKNREWAEAETQAQASLDFSHEIDDRHAQGRTYRQLGLIARDQAQWTSATDYFNSSISTFTDLGDELWTARGLSGLARLRDARGQDSSDLRGRIDDIFEQCHIEPGRWALCLAEW